MDVDALSREMAINAKAIQQQAMKDPTKLVMRTQAEQITDEQHEQAQKITDEAMRYERSLISTQVENGIAVRMAVLHWLKPETDKD